MSNQKHATTQSRIRALLRWLTQPNNTIVDDAMRRRIQTYLTLMLIASVFNVVLLALRTIMGTQTRILPYSTLAVLLLYVINRISFREITLQITISLILTLPLVFYFYAPERITVEFLLSVSVTSMAAVAFFTDLRISTQIIVWGTLVNVLLAVIVEDFTLPTRIQVVIIPTVVGAIVLTYNYVNSLDQAQLREQAQALDKQQAQFQQIFSALPNAVIVHSDDRILYSNKRALDLLGIEAEDISQQSLRQYLIGDSTKDMRRDSSRDPFTLHYSDMVRNVDGDIFPVDVTITPMTYLDTVATLSVIEPVTANSGTSTAQSNKIPPVDTSLLPKLLSDYFYVIDAIDINPTLRFLAAGDDVIFGIFSEPSLTVDEFIAYVHPDDRPLVEMRFSNLQQGDTQTIEYRLLHNNNIIWVEDAAQSITSEAEDVSRIGGLVRDISIRVKAEEALRENIIQQAVVSELGLLAISHDDDDEIEVFNHAVLLCNQVMESAHTCIFIHDEKDEQLHLVSPRSDSIALPQAIQLTADATDSEVAFTFVTKDVVVIPDITTDNRFTIRDSILKSDFKSAICVPILGHDRTYGVMALYAHNPDVISDETAYFIQSVANVLGTFMAHHRILQSERAERDFVQILQEMTMIISSRDDIDEVLDSILHYIKQIVPQHYSASVMLIDTDKSTEDKSCFGFVAVTGLTKTVWNSIKDERYTLDDVPNLHRMVDGKPLIINDVTQNPDWVNITDGIKAYLGAPIIVDEQCIGFLHLDSRQKNAFTERDAEHLVAFADKTGNAIVNVRRTEQLEQMVQARTLELQIEREQLQAILENTGDGIFYTEGSEIHFVNETLCKMTGYSVEELIGQTSTMLQQPEEEADDEDEQLPESVRLSSIIRTAANIPTSREETRIKRKDGSMFEAGLTISFMGLTDKGKMRAVTIVRDISQAKELEAKQMRFIGNAAHELRAPISTLNTRMYLIRKSPDNMERHIERLDSVVTRINQLIADLLDMSYFDSGQIQLHPANVIVQNFLQNVLDMQEDEATLQGVNLVSEFSEDPISLWADPNRMEQVVLNLVRNAIRFTPEDGTVTIACRLSDNQAAVIIEVRDTGVGIEAEHLTNIFQPFYSAQGKANKDGTGLGLSIAKEIVERHGGYITVQSEVDVGTSFFVILPLMDG